MDVSYPQHLWNQDTNAAMKKLNAFNARFIRRESQQMHPFSLSNHHAWLGKMNMCLKTSCKGIQEMLLLVFVPLQLKQLYKKDSRMDVEYQWVLHSNKSC